MPPGPRKKKKKTKEQLEVIIREFWQADRQHRIKLFFDSVELERLKGKKTWLSGGIINYFMW